MSELFDKASMYGFTENGAFTHTGTGSKVLDLFSMGGGLRDSDEDRIINIVKNAAKIYVYHAKKNMKIMIYWI